MSFKSSKLSSVVWVGDVGLGGMGTLNGGSANFTVFLVVRLSPPTILAGAGFKAGLLGIIIARNCGFFGLNVL